VLRSFARTAWNKFRKGSERLSSKIWKNFVRPRETDWRPVARVNAIAAKLKKSNKFTICKK
jgi:hypothetical protein